jgi:hypothetical protein
LEGIIRQWDVVGLVWVMRILGLTRVGGVDVGGEAGFSAPQFGKARTAPVEMTAFWGWMSNGNATATQEQLQTQKQVPCGDDKQERQRQMQQQKRRQRQLQLGHLQKAGALWGYKRER